MASYTRVDVISPLSRSLVISSAFVLLRRVSLVTQPQRNVPRWPPRHRRKRMEILQELGEPNIENFDRSVILWVHCSFKRSLVLNVGRKSGGTRSPSMSSAGIPETKPSMFHKARIQRGSKSLHTSPRWRSSRFPLKSAIDYLFINPICILNHGACDSSSFSTCSYSSRIGALWSFGPCPAPDAKNLRSENPKVKSFQYRWILRAMVCTLHTYYAELTHR